MEVLRLRRQGLTQAEVAKSLGTSRENVSIIERNAFRTLKAAKSTIEAFESLDADNSVTIPVRTSIYDIPRIILVRGDVLGVRIKTTSDDILAMVKSKGKIRAHHLISPMTVEISQDGRLIIK
jgi:Tfx family DNA-binding protein